MRLPEHVEARELHRWDRPKSFLQRRREVMRNAREHLRDAAFLDIRHPSWEAYHVGVVAQSLSIPFVVELHGDWHECAMTETNASLLRRLTRRYRASKGRRIYNELTAKSQGVLCIGPALAEKYVPPGKRLLVTANNVVESRDFFDRADFSLHDPPCILFVGSLLWTKGLQYLFEAMASLKETGQDFQLVVVGVGPAREGLQRFAQQKGFADKVRFAGVVPHGRPRLEMYRTADLFVLPSLSEGVARVIHEAMSQGCPIVSTSVGGTPWLVQDGSGILVPPGDTPKLAEAILSILRDASLRRRLSERAVQAARAHCYDTQRAEIAAFLRSVVPAELLAEPPRSSGSTA